MGAEGQQAGRVRGARGGARARGAARRTTRGLAPPRYKALLGVVGLAASIAAVPGCAEFDTQRTPPKRGSVGEEVYGVLCDRLAAQALREDLSGESFRAVCHRPVGGDFADTVDASKLPALRATAVDERGHPVSLAKQRADRDEAIGRIEAFARRRTDLVRALDAVFPEGEKIALKDLASADPTRSCEAPKKSGEGLLVDELANMLGRMGDLYNDGTVPHSTASLARVIAAFQDDEEAQAAWARISARQGYRPNETALGPLRPILAYPRLRDFANASLRLLSADAIPYELNPQRDADGNRIPVAGPGNTALNKLLETFHEELLVSDPDETRSAPLKITTDATGRVVLSRPRDNLEILEELVTKEDDAFQSEAARYIVRRDARGYAKITGGLVPAPFVDADGDGLPDVDEVGRFKTANGSIPPSPFPYPGAPAAARDEHGRATAGSALLYEYIDTSRTFAAQLLRDLRPLVNSDPEAKHETLMDMIGGLPIVLGPRETRTKDYGEEEVEYDGIRTKDSPLLDLVYAVGAILGDKTTDATLAMTRELFTTKSKEMARLTGALSGAFDIAQQHPEASIPRTSTFWDENLDVMAKVAAEPGLLEDILRALAAPETAQLGNALSRFARLRDEVSYDRDDINGLPYDVTTKSRGEMKTPVDRDAPTTGLNRSALHRFIQLVSDVDGVAACNKADARVHAKLAGVSVTMPLSGGYAECEVFKIDNLAEYYVSVMGRAWEFDPPSKPNKRGAMYLRDDLLRTGIAGIGAATTEMLEESSGLLGFVDTGNDKNLTPTPRWLNRLVFFDTKNDSPNPGDVNYKTNYFIRELSGDYMGTSVCPERVIEDPVPGAPDASPDGKVHGLRNCPAGSWLQERGKNTLFTLENFGFYDAVRPLVSAFAKHGREDLFVALSVAAYRHYPNEDASAAECRLADGQQCTREGASSYEALLGDVFATDLFPALSELAKALDTLPIKTCTKTDPSGACTADGVQTVSGIEVAAAATRAMLDPAYSKQMKLTDRGGLATTKRNDGSPVAQVTPAYLLTNALSAIDAAFDAYEEQNPNDTERRANWRRARSQLVDQFLGTTGIKSNTTFANPTVPKMTPLLVDMLRAQLWARCPRSFVPPYEECKWAREELTNKAEESLAGPLATAGIDMTDAIRRDPDGRRELQRLLEYLLDPASKNDALASLLASTNDLAQALRDDDDLEPLYRVLAAAVDGSKYDARGKLTQKSLVDAQMALLARVSGKYVDKDGAEICKNEVDPNQVLASVLAKLVTPIKDGDFDGQTPLEVIIDVVADVNRQDPTAPYEGTLAQTDYASVSSNVISFLNDPESGLEQLYAVIRGSTKF